MITLLLIADSDNRAWEAHGLASRFTGSFLLAHSTETIGDAQEWFARNHADMLKEGCLKPEDTAYGLTFADRTLDEIECEFPYLFGYGECDCEHGGRRHE